MSSFHQVVVHYGSRAVLLVGFFLARKLATGRKRRNQYTESYNIINPDSYKASNPRWMALWGASDVENVLECPLIKEFQEAFAFTGGVRDILECYLPELFCLEKGTCYLNHGSYGATLKLCLEVQSWFRQKMEAEPVRFMEQELFPALRAAIGSLGRFVGARPQDIVPVHNTTYAINAVLNSVELGQGDLIMMTSLTYSAVRNCIARVAAKRGAAILEVKLTKDILSDRERILDAFQIALEAGRPRVKLAVLDHIISCPPVVMPLQDVACLCQREGVKVMVDGAHAVGSVPLKISDLPVQFYVSNLHKWLCTPKGTAFLWVHPREQKRVLPLVTSHGCGMGFQEEFVWSGTDDLSGWLSVPAAIAVFEKLGMQNVRDRNERLLRSAVELLQEKWDTSECLGLDDNTAGMALVEMPKIEHVSPDAAGAFELHGILRNDFSVEVPVIYWEGCLWVRISSQLYNSLSDYETLASAVLELQQALSGNQTLPP